MPTRRTLWMVILLLAAASASRAQEQPAPQDGQQYEFREGQWVPVPAPAEGTPAGELSLIRKHVADQSPRTALRAVGRFVKRYPGDPLSEEVYYLAGQAEMQRGRYFQAYEQFERQLGQYPNGQFSQRALEREMEVAKAFLAGKRRIVLGFLPMPAAGDGLDILGRIVEHAPGTPLADDALMTIADYHYAEREYPEAMSAYDRYVEQFPQSERAPLAVLQAARASYAAWNGVAYDETPLLEARQRFRIFLRDYPEQARQAGVSNILVGIEENLADKEYETARFYERTGRKSSAVFYYRSVIRDYPATQAAGKAQSKLEELGQSAGS